GPRLSIYISLVPTTGTYPTNKPRRRRRTSAASSKGVLRLLISYIYLPPNHVQSYPTIQNRFPDPSETIFSYTTSHYTKGIIGKNWHSPIDIYTGFVDICYK
ncbi:unnamed protein product, partial [Meganyctiphanes norvegica]